MSGGSYEYFYSRAPETLRAYASDLERMADRCAERAAGPAEAHWKTKTDIDLAALGECGVYLRAIAWRMKAMATLLANWEDVTRGVEWWESGDSGIEAVVESFSKLMAERSARMQSTEMIQETSTKGASK